MKQNSSSYLNKKRKNISTRDNNIKKANPTNITKGKTHKGPKSMIINNVNNQTENSTYNINDNTEPNSNFSTNENNLQKEDKRTEQLAKKDNKKKENNYDSENSITSSEYEDFIFGSTIKEKNETIKTILINHIQSGEMEKMLL